MFIRTRRRPLKGGHPSARLWRRPLPSYAVSYELVRAVRRGGTSPRHEYVCGLGSLKEHADLGGVVRFWRRATASLRRLGLDEDARLALVVALARKGVPLPTPEECARYDHPAFGPAVRDAPLLARARATLSPAGRPPTLASTTP